MAPSVRPGGRPSEALWKSRSSGTVRTAHFLRVDGDADNDLAIELAAQFGIGVWCV